MNLIIDIGNTKQKFAVVDQDTIMYLKSSSKIKITEINQIFEKYPIKKALVSNVVNNEDVKDLLMAISEKTLLVNFSEITNISVINTYKTPETLGNDRLAVAVGSRVVFSGENTLIIQIGTCITYDFVDKNSEYQGGSISPGMMMRLKALHHFTKKLPLVPFREFGELIGKSTEESILSGVIQGVSSEIDGIIDKYKSTNHDLRIIMTGGGAKNFEKLLKNKIFAIPNLVIIGLNHLLEIHEPK